MLAVGIEDALSTECRDFVVQVSLDRLSGDSWDAMRVLLQEQLCCMDAPRKIIARRALHSQSYGTLLGKYVVLMDADDDNHAEDDDPDCQEPPEQVGLCHRHSATTVMIPHVMKNMNAKKINV